VWALRSDRQGNEGKSACGTVPSRLAKVIEQSPFRTNDLRDNEDKTDSLKRKCPKRMAPKSGGHLNRGGT